MPSYGDTAKQHYEELKGLVKSDGWKPYKESGGITLEYKPMNNISIDCYKAVGHSDKSPAYLADHCMAMTHDDWKKFDPTILAREEISQDPLVIYQGHSLAWPCSSRDFVMEMGRYTDSDGSEYVVLKSVNHEKVPEKKGFVRGSVLVSGFIFISDGKGGSQIVRIVQVDPAGSIPAFVVNSQAASFMTDVEKISKF